MSDPFDAVDRVDGVTVPLDPMDMLHCDSCQ